MTPKWAPQTRYMLGRNTANKMKDSVLLAILNKNNSDIKYYKAKLFFDIFNVAVARLSTSK